jgi:hypothetical protein
MKNQVGRLAILGVTAFVLNTGWVLAADSTADATSAPGTAASNDSKNSAQENTPAGPSTQTTATTPAGTKKHHKKPKGTAPVANQAGDTTSKGVQAGTSPATNTGTATPSSSDMNK